MAGRVVNYESLPCIDSSGKDVFETGGENVSQQKGLENDELHSESVEHFKVNQGKAFGAFKDKYVDSTDLDFSDRLGPYSRTGYETKTTYEIIGEKISKETPQQKYQRLQHELRELAEEVEHIKTSVTEAEKEAKMSPVQMAQEVRQLQSQLQNLQLEKVLGTESLTTGGIPHGSWTRQILTQLESFKGKEMAKGGAGKDKIVYELYYQPEHSKFSHAAKANDLEQRLAKLENLVGKDTQKMTSVIAEPEGNPTTLMDSVAVLRGKLSLLDPNNVEIVDARVQGLLHHINQTLSKKDSIAVADHQTKINELFDICKKWDEVADVLPDLVKRLRALQGLHTQASNFSESLALLESTQGQVKDLLQSQKGMMEKLEKTFAENSKSIRDNCTSLDSRITALVGKLDG